MRKNSVKNNRINGEVMRQLGMIIRNDIKDPRISPMVSVVAVNVTPDLKFCKAYISVLGTQEELTETIKGLKSAEGYIRRELARTINLRNTPEITFVPDNSIEYGVHMSHMIDEVMKNQNTDADEESDEESDEEFDEEFDEESDESELEDDEDYE